MFQDSIIVHKNMDNRIHVKISDRDRVRYKIEDADAVPFQLKLRIMDRRDVVVSLQYLTPVVEGDFFSVTLTRELLDELEADEEYGFIMTKVEGEVETPLYLDHDFQTKGLLEVRGNFVDIKTEKYTRTEEYLVFKDYEKSRLEMKHFFSHIPCNNEKLYAVRVMSAEGAKDCMITVEKNLQSHYPLSEKEEQWKSIMTVQHEGTTHIPISMIGDRVHMRIVLHTPSPEDYYMEVDEVSR